MTGPETTGRITREDIEARFRDIQGEVAETEQQAANLVTIIGAAVVVGVVVVAFALGSRRGRKRRTIVEIRRG